MPLPTVLAGHLLYSAISFLHLSPPHALAHRARRPPALLRHLLPPPLSSACPCPPCSQATCSTPPSPSSTSLLRMPLPTVLAGHLLYSAISFLHLSPPHALAHRAR